MSSLLMRLQSWQKQAFAKVGYGLFAGVVACSSLTVSQAAHASDPFIAQITMFGGNFAPRGWAFCDGQLLPIASNTALFSILGTTFGGDGRTTFALPDLRGRAAIHPGRGPGLSDIRLGEKGGVETVTLGINHIPPHTHDIVSTLKGVDVSGDVDTPSQAALASKSRTDIYLDMSAGGVPDVDMAPGSVVTTAASTGGGQAFSIRNPYLGINHIIALVGIFPSRS